MFKILIFADLCSIFIFFVTCNIQDIIRLDALDSSNFRFPLNFRLKSSSYSFAMNNVQNKIDLETELIFLDTFYSMIRFLYCWKINIKLFK